MNLSHTFVLFCFGLLIILLLIRNHRKNHQHLRGVNPWSVEGELVAFEHRTNKKQIVVNIWIKNYKMFKECRIDSLIDPNLIGKQVKINFSDYGVEEIAEVEECLEDK